MQTTTTNYCTQTGYSNVVCPNEGVCVRTITGFSKESVNEQRKELAEKSYVPFSDIGEFESTGHQMYHKDKITCHVQLLHRTAHKR